MIGNPFPLKENIGKSFQGTIVLGKGFVLTPDEAATLIAKDPRNKDVLFPYLNGDDLNNDPEQVPSRWVINFFDWPEEKAKRYPDCFKILEQRVKPERQRWKIDNSGKEIVGTYALRNNRALKWWQHAERASALYETISKLDQVMVSCRVSKYVNQSLIASGYIFDVTTTVIARSNLWEFAFFQNSLHTEWAWKYASTMKGDIRYISGNCIDTFPFPPQLRAEQRHVIEEICKKYLSLRAQIMHNCRLGLTKVCNHIHNPVLTKGVAADDLDIEDKAFEKKYGKETANLRKHLNKGFSPYSIIDACNFILALRSLYRELDDAILNAYGWTDITLRHDFYELEYLPETDRIRYTIHPNARKEVLKRLLQLNLQSHSEIVGSKSDYKKLQKKTEVILPYFDGH